MQSPITKTGYDILIYLLQCILKIWEGHSGLSDRTWTVHGWTTGLSYLNNKSEDQDGIYSRGYAIVPAYVYVNYLKCLNVISNSLVKKVSWSEYYSHLLLWKIPVKIAYQMENWNWNLQVLIKLFLLFRNKYLHRCYKESTQDGKTTEIFNASHSTLKNKAWWECSLIPDNTTPHNITQTSYILLIISTNLQISELSNIFTNSRMLVHNCKIHLNK